MLRSSHFLPPTPHGWVGIGPPVCCPPPLLWPAQIRLGCDISERRPLAPFQHLPKHLHCWFPPSIVEVPVTHPVSNGGVGERIGGNRQEFFRRDLPLLHQEQPVIAVVLDDVHVRVDGLKHLASFVIPTEVA